MARESLRDGDLRLPLEPRRGAIPGAFLQELGIVAPGFGIIQIDINPVHRRAGSFDTEVTLCDHNCTVTIDGRPTGGHYSCPAAMSLNPGVGARDVAPTALLTDGLLHTIDGLRMAQRIFLDEDLPRYLNQQRVPARLRPEFTAALSSPRQVVNLFGGSPDLHPGCLDIVRTLHENGIEVHLTTTGRRIIREPRFRAALQEEGPDLLAVSVDDVESVTELDELFTLDRERLSDLWRHTPASHGQRRKTLEAVQLCKLARLESFPPLLFNVVIHQGNVDEFEELLDILTAQAPDALINAYPVQSAFLGEPAAFDAGGLDRLGALTEAMIKVQVRRYLGDRPRWNLTPRLTYWLVLASILDSDASARVRADRVGGGDAWRCYARRGAGRCVQIGCAPPGTPRREFAGGYPGCFWNGHTVTEDRQFWDMSDTQLADWVLHGRQRRAAQAAEPCRGCLFPRMTLDGVSLELGLSADLVGAYHTRRSRYLGY
jgi:hypothetical protein